MTLEKDIPTPVQAASSAEANWYLPKRPEPPKSSEAHILAHASTPTMVRICYTKGPEGSFVGIRANTSGGPNVATNLWLGACVDIGGTDIEISNPNSEPVSGTYMRV